MSKDDELIAVPYEAKFKSTGEGGATAYNFPDIDKPVWIPNSQIEDNDDVRNEILIPEWLATEKGLV